MSSVDKIELSAVQDISKFLNRISRSLISSYKCVSNHNMMSQGTRVFNCFCASRDLQHNRQVFLSSNQTYLVKGQYAPMLFITGC